jgi:Phage integrase family
VRLSQQPETFERYAAGKIAAGLSPKTVRNHLVLLGLLFRTARRWRWVQENPLELVDKPPAGEGETETVDAGTIAELLAAYRLLEADADESDRFWLEAARRMTVVALSTGLRRGELLGLRWKDVDLLERAVTVRQQFVRNDHDPEVEGGAEDGAARPRGGRCARGAVEGPRAPGRRQHRVLPPGARNTVGPVEALPVRSEGAHPGQGAELLQAVARPPSHGAHGDRRGRRTRYVRAGEGRARARLDDRAVPPRAPDALPGFGGARRGPPFFNLPDAQ